MKKTIYDLRKDTRGRVDAMKHGLFEHSWELANVSDRPFPVDDYILIELPRCVYRLRKSDQNDPAFMNFIEAAKKKQSQA